MGQATYNWSIRPGVKNRYGIIIPPSEDWERPGDNHAYFATWGSDETGNGSRMYPFKTPNSNYYGILASGVYRGLQGFYCYADGNVIFDNEIAGSDINVSFCFGAKIRSSYSVSCNESRYCEFKAKANIVNNQAYYQQYNTYETGFSDTTKIFLFARRYELALPLSGNNTFVNSRVLISPDQHNHVLNNGYFSIFDNCEIEFNSLIPRLDYCLFNNCKFRMAYVEGEQFQEFDSIDDLTTWLKSKMDGAELLGWENCAFGDPKFNNPEIGDYTLAFDSPAKNMHYNGTFIGAKPIAVPLKITDNAEESGLDLSTAINLTIAPNTAKLTDRNLAASIESKPIVNLTGRRILSLPTFGYNADRNGEYIDSTPDLSNVPTQAGEILQDGTPYLVVGGSIVYNGEILPDDSRFVSLRENAGTFSTVVDAYVVEILEAPARENVECRFSNGTTTTISAGTSLEVGAWYHVEQAEITYNSATVAMGKCLKCVEGQVLFTGAGVLRKIFDLTSPWNYFEINQPLTSNNEGNFPTGAIMRGNGDRNFDRSKPFKIYHKFSQVRYTIQPNNLAPPAYEV
ncbi:hypothetical protein G7074_15810 [Pedobacter sp. HDW13]|uniref:hypothetical protein n=1 Tax=Pedobacter sp. HDW13 TaxID=2714940 RepID=UPI00140AFD09|nr:hypothetical protein [Pedobacter sp. HDW13]QIL40602.1 hypothetical protein G7074_15810 [Pedobacter sp. HDW13]